MSESGFFTFIPFSTLTVTLTYRGQTHLRKQRKAKVKRVNSGEYIKRNYLRQVET